MERNEDLFKITIRIAHLTLSHDDLYGMIAEKFNTGVIQKDGEAELFLAGNQLSGFLRYLEELKAMGCTIDVDAEKFDSYDWQHEWKRFIKPIRVGKKLIIRPSWEKVAKDEGIVEIIIDPEMAFGTGHHETTQLCLEWLERYTISKPIQDMSLLDVGTGSGIIAITAAKLGFGMAVGIDIDTDAIGFAARNVEKNWVKSRVRLIAGTIDCLMSDFDILIANINAGVLKDIAPLLFKVMKKNKQSLLVLSGILASQKNDIVDVYIKYGLKCLEYYSKGEWCLLVFAL